MRVVTLVRAGAAFRSPTPSLRGAARQFSINTALGAPNNAAPAQPEQPEENDQSVVRKLYRSGGPRRKNVFSGIQPTGIPHLGNYLGALRQWKQLQDQKLNNEIAASSSLLFCIVDLHALTHEQSSAQLWQQRRDTLASLLAIGLDPDLSILFFQSEVPQHAQLMWYLSCLAKTGYLSRMTQWKSKLGIDEDAALFDQAAREKLSLGLFSYPVLQAADILLYRANEVPVGGDQAQHVEFTRHLARSFNHRFNEAHGGDFFTLPKAIFSPAKRIMALTEPTTKMSKSHPDPDSRILITDSADEIRRKIKRALTDSTPGITYDPAARPGVSNLLEILRHVTNETATCEELASDMQLQTMRALKEHVAERVVNALAGFGDRFEELSQPSNEALREASKAGQVRAKTIAGQTLKQMDRLMGLRRPRDKGIQPGSSDAPTAQKNRERIMREQTDEERDQVDEPDVVPQSSEGVDRPIAS